MAASRRHHESSIPSPPAAAGGRLWRTWFDQGEPHPYRGPLTRWPHTTDGVIALGVFAMSLVAVAVSALGDSEGFTLSTIGDLPVGVFALLAFAAAALLWRRRHPIAITGFVLAVMVAWAFAGYGDGQELALIVAVYSVGRCTSDHLHSAATAAAALAFTLIGSVIDTNQRIDIAPAIILIGLSWYVGRRVRNRGDYLTLLQERAKRLEAEQHASARQAVTEERSRIARELHDVVAHQVSMMTVQAGAAKTIAREDLDSAIDAMGDVERAGRRALGELRHLLGVLRPDTADHDDLGPQPGLDEIATLADELRNTGAKVTLTMADLPDSLPAAVHLSAYRIVQESCTNIIKHAGANPTVNITVGVDDDGLAIDIANSTKVTRPGLPASGFGIAGMSERASLLGGTLDAGPRSTNQYGVYAHIPLELEPT